MSANVPPPGAIAGGPLSGIRVLDFTRYQQGPMATVFLSDLGCEVVKVEEPGGEPGRANGLQPDGFSAYFEAHNRGKKSITLDLRIEAARDAARRLVPGFDVVVENFRPGVMERWGLGYDDLRGLREDIILASGSSWGRLGPWGNRPGYDHVGQALSGVMVEQGGGPGRPPHALIGGFADQIGAMLLATGVASAIVARERFGIGQHVDVSLIGAMTALQAMPLTRYLRTGNQIGFEERRAATYTHYECADGKYVAIAANTQAFWERLCDALERPDLRDDPRFAGPFDRAEHKDALVEEFERHFRTRTSTEWCERLTSADVPNAPVLDYAGLAEHPQFWENGYLQEIDHPNLGRMRVTGPAIRMSATPTSVQGGGPELGQHTEEVLLAAGFTWDEVAALRESGATRTV
ncbi:MAG: CoA transferase [Dehalococcoidia bacterium]|nr:CoA transferase [Dehalococcoidia bacterium]